MRSVTCRDELIRALEVLDKAGESAAATYLAMAIDALPPFNTDAEAELERLRGSLWP